MLIRLKDGSGSVNLKYISEEPDRHGNIRVYFRKRGSARRRLRAEVGTEAFLREYKDALAGQQSAVIRAPAVVSGTLRWLWVQYSASPAFGRLDKATQAMRRGQIENMLPKWGLGLLAELSAKYVRRMVDDKAGTGDAYAPHAADNLLKTLRALFKWAVTNDYMTTNPARDVEKINEASEGHHTWTVDEIKQYRKRHPENTKAGLALALLLGSPKLIYSSMLSGKCGTSFPADSLGFLRLCVAPFGVEGVSINERVASNRISPQG